MSAKIIDFARVKHDRKKGKKRSIYDAVRTAMADAGEVQGVVIFVMGEDGYQGRVVEFGEVDMFAFLARCERTIGKMTESFFESETEEVTA